MKTPIGLFLFLVLIAGLLTSCLKTKFYEGSTTTGGNTINIVSSNGIPTNINFSVTQTQYVKGAAFEIKASNAIPVELLAPTNSLTVQVTNPISLLLTQAQAIQATLTISNKFESTNFTGAITLKLDPASASLLPSTIAITSTPIQMIWGGTTNILPQFREAASINPKHDGMFGFVALIVIIGALSRLLSYASKNRRNKIVEDLKQFVDFFEIDLSKEDDVKFLIFIDLVLSGLAAFLASVATRIAFGFDLPESWDDINGIVKAIGFAVLAGLLGVKFIYDLISLWQGFVAKMNPNSKTFEGKLKLTEANLETCKNEREADAKRKIEQIGELQFQIRKLETELAITNRTILRIEKYLYERE